MAQPKLGQPRRLEHLDQRGSDKYYRSGQVSVFGTKPGQPPRAPSAAATRRALLDDRSGDKYYRALPLDPTDGEIAAAGGTVPVRAVRSLVAPVLPGTATLVGQDVFRVTQAQDVQATADAVCARLNAGAAAITVEAADLPGLPLRVRTAIEARVAREQITEDQYRDVRFVTLPPATEALPSQSWSAGATPRGTREVGPDFAGDPEDFLAADAGDEMIDTAAVPAADVLLDPGEDEGEAAAPAVAAIPIPFDRIPAGHVFPAGEAPATPAPEDEADVPADETDDAADDGDDDGAL